VRTVRRGVTVLGLLSVGLLFSGLPSVAQIELVYTHWGSDLEAAAMKELCAQFNEQYPDIKATPVHILWENYIEKVSAMIAAGTPPHVGFVMETVALDWAEQGILLDLLPLMEEDPDPSVKLENRLSTIRWMFDGGKKTLGTSVAAEVMVVWYNKDIFDAEGVPYPPTDPQEWTWDRFVDTAKKLTRDVNGRRPGKPGFDPDNIMRFGIVFGSWYMTWFPFIWSNGGDLSDESGRIPTINEPEAVEALQRLVDLIYKLHVAPTPAQLGALPAFHIALETQQAAMVIDGQWALQQLGELVKAGTLRLGVAPLPMLKEPVTAVIGTPGGIYADAVKEPEVLAAAWEFYKFLTNSERSLSLIRCGLWQPIQTWWYTDPNYIEMWLDPEIHPAEYKEAVIDYTLKYARPAPTYYLKNFAQIVDIMQHELDAAFLGEVPVQKACDMIAERIKPLLTGRYDRP